MGHSPDPDDAFMYWALTTDLVDTRGFRFRQVLADRDLSEREPEDEIGRRQRARDDDLDPLQLVGGERLAGDDDRAVAGPDRGAVRQQRVVLLDERVRGE